MRRLFPIYRTRPLARRGCEAHWLRMSTDRTRIKRFKGPTPAAGAALSYPGDTVAGNAADRLRVEACLPRAVPAAFGVVAIGTEAVCAGRQQDDAVAGERGARLPDGIGQVRRTLQREAGRARQWRKDVVDASAVLTHGHDRHGRACLHRFGETRPVQPTVGAAGKQRHRSEEHTSELQSLMRNSYAVFWFKDKRMRN